MGNIRGWVVMVMVVVVLVDIVIVYISSLGFGNMGQMRTGAKKKKYFLY